MSLQSICGICGSPRDLGREASEAAILNAASPFTTESMITDKDQDSLTQKIKPCIGESMDDILGHLEVIFAVAKKVTRGDTMEDEVDRRG
jgi:hypothetical protein